MYKRFVVLLLCLACVLVFGSCEKDKNMEKSEAEPQSSESAVTAIVSADSMVSSDPASQSSQRSLPDYTLIVRKSGQNTGKTIPLGEIGYSYDLHYFGCESVHIMYKGGKYDLAEAVKRKVVNLNRILEKGWTDSQMGEITALCRKDGGTTEYCYDDYTIIKYNTLDGLRDICICPTGVDKDAFHQFDDRLRGISQTGYPSVGETEGESSTAR